MQTKAEQGAAMELAVQAIERHAGMSRDRFPKSWGGGSHAERDFDAEALPASPGPDRALADALASYDALKFQGDR